MFMVPNFEKKRRLLHASMFVTIDRITMSPKNGGKKSFSYETKASMSFIPMRIMHLWFSIMKRNEIIMRIHVYPN